MAKENVENIIRTGYAAANAGDFDGLLPLLHPDIQFNSLIAEVEGRTYWGHAGARQWWESVALSMSGLRFEPQRIEVFDNTAVVRLRVSGTIDQVEVPQTMWHTIKVSAGLITWWHLARSRTEALKAAGLSE